MSVVLIRMLRIVWSSVNRRLEKQKFCTHIVKLLYAHRILSLYE